MPAKKRYFTKNKEKIYHSVQDRRSIGNKSGKAREKEAKLLTQKLPKEKTTKENSLKLLHLPNIPQNITDHALLLTWKRGLLLGFYIIIAGISVWQAIIFVQRAIVLGEIGMQRESLSQDMKLWEAVGAKYPTYRDAYFQAAVLAYRLGDTSKEQVFLGKTLELDPNYEPARNLQKLSR